MNANINLIFLDHWYMYLKIVAVVKYNGPLVKTTF